MSNSQKSAHYKENARRINAALNGGIMRIKSRGFLSAESALEQIKTQVEIAQDRYEIRHGYAKLEISRESYDFIIELCEKCSKEYAERYNTYSEAYSRRKSEGLSDQDLTYLSMEIQKSNSKAIAYRSVLGVAKRNRETLIWEESEKARKLAEEDSDGEVILKAVLTVGLCIMGIIVMASVGGLIGAVALLGAVIGGIKLLNIKM